MFEANAKLPAGIETMGLESFSCIPQELNLSKIDRCR